jgi:3',5'-cyclic AMP phosphodiesterase CpdA
LELLKQQYCHEFPEAALRQSEVVVVQLSDIHIGSKEASLRLPRLQQLVRNLIAEIGENRRYVFAVSGDLMDNPEERNLDSVRAFIDFLSNLGGEALLTCLGNHDVRTDGYLSENLRMVMRVPQTNTAVTWLDDQRVGFVVFNSVIGGNLARGLIGEQQLLDLGSEIDRNPDWKYQRIVGVLHHHPVPIALPEWYSRPFYERLFGKKFDKTDELVDAAKFSAFVESRRFRCVLHGHKHIPHISAANNVPVFGCGSSVGKVDTKDGNPYMSVNVITLDTESGNMTARLLAERIPGGGLQEEKRHEMVSRSAE